MKCCREEVIADPEVDAIVIGTWPYMHKTMVLAALAAGKHVMTEARMAMNSAEAREMLAAGAAAPHPLPPKHLWHCTSCQTRPLLRAYLPAELTVVVGGVAARAKPSLITQIVPSPMTLSYDATIQRLIREGALGQLLHVDVKGCGGAPLDAERPLHWRNQMEYSGLNIMTLGIFYASPSSPLCRFLRRPVVPLSCSAEPPGCL